jgi:hypothetical protein
MRPASGVTMPAIMCSSVVLPEPLLPIKATCSPSAIPRRSMSMTGTTLPSGPTYCFFRFSR